MKKFVYCCVIALLAAGCATTESSRITSKLSLGMTREEVLKTCGQPYASGAAFDPDTGASKEYLVYKETIYPGDYFRPYEALMTNVFIVGGKVVQYGPANKLATKKQQDSFVAISSNPDIYVAKP
jgi:hypothetical protein